MTALVVTVAAHADPEAVRRALVARGLWVTAAGGAFVVAPHSAAIDVDSLRAVPGVAAVVAPGSAHPLVDAHPPRVRIRGVDVGVGAAPAIVAGPCSVESEAQIRDAAERVAAAGARFLRGGAFKPRTSPYTFQGHGERALAWLRRAADAAGLLVVTEATAPEEMRAVAAVADVIQIGARNMSAFALLRAAGAAGRPVLLKRGPAATIEEWLCAGEHCLAAGAPAVIFCERGVRGFDPATRNLVDLGAVALLAHIHRLPVLVDPSHGAGRRDLIAPLALAAVAAGAAGVMIETHDDPGAALSDGPQAISTADLARIAARLAPAQRAGERRGGVDTAPPAGRMSHG
jgi:3-deoxy-7-phosphoheptulonate synthase